MNLLKTFTATMILAVTMTMGSCSDKSAETLTKQCERLNSQLAEMQQNNPDVIASASASYVDNKFTVDATLCDSLFMTSQITEPLFNYFTAIMVKQNINKDLEETVNALADKNIPMTVNLTDVYNETRSYELSAALFRRMVKSPLTQLNYNEAREALFFALEAGQEQFRTADPIAAITSSYNKNKFYSYNVEFENVSSFKSLTLPNLKARALKVFEHRYANLGTFRPVLLEMYKSLGVDGFYLVYTAKGTPYTMKTTISLSKL